MVLRTWSYQVDHRYDLFSRLPRATLVCLPPMLLRARTLGFSLLCQPTQQRQLEQLPCARMRAHHDREYPVCSLIFEHHKYIPAWCDMMYFVLPIRVRKHTPGLYQVQSKAAGTFEDGPVYPLKYHTAVGCETTNRLEVVCGHGRERDNECVPPLLVKQTQPPAHYTHDRAGNLATSRSRAPCCDQSCLAHMMPNSLPT